MLTLPRGMLDLIEMQYQIYFSFPFDWNITKEIFRFNEELKKKDKAIYHESHGTMVCFIRLQPTVFYPIVKFCEKLIHS